MASIHEVKDENDKTISYYVAYRFKDRSGKTKQSIKRGFQKKKEAETFKREVETDYYNNVVKVTDSMTVSALMGEWEKSLTKRQSMGDLATNTVNGYKVNIRHIKDGIGNIKLIDLTTEAIEDFYLNQYESGNYRTGEALSATSIRYIDTNLRNALTYGVQKHFLKFNPAIGATKVAKQLKQPRICSANEISMIRQHTLGTELEMPVFIALSLGLRRGEVLGLKWDRIDFEAKTIRIEEQWALGPNGYAFAGLKSNYSRRTLPLDDGMAITLLAAKSVQDSIKCELGDQYFDHGLVCCQKNGMPIRPEYMSQAFSRLIDKLEILSLRFHDLRHTFASLALSNNVPLLTVSRMLGHASISITADIYGHPTDEAFRNGASLSFDAVWGKK
jgi:integrase